MAKNIYIYLQQRTHFLHIYIIYNIYILYTYSHFSQEASKTMYPIIMNRIDMH
jgi:hypothetical protein